MNDYGRKTLAIITPGFYEQCIGGSEYQSYLLAEAARNRGITVHYMYIKIGGICSVPNLLNIHLHSTKRPSYNRFIRFLGHTEFLCIPSVYKILRSIKPDYVYCRGGVAHAGLGTFYARRYMCKSVWHVASSNDVNSKRILDLIMRPLNLIERLSVIYAIKYSTIVVAQAKFQAKLLMNNYGRCASIISQAAPEPQETLIKYDNITIVWIANIKPLKQPEVFISLARRFIHRKNVHFVMVGRPAVGEYQKQLEIQQSELVNFNYLGEQPMEEANRLISKSHIFVNTSKYEGFPNTFIQSWMREVPVVSLLFDPDSIISTRRIGFYAGSFEQMVRDVNTLIDDVSLRSEMGKRARAYALEHHSFKYSMDCLLNQIIGD